MRALAKLAPLLDGEGKKLSWLADTTSTSHLPSLSLRCCPIRAAASERHRCSGKRRCGQGDGRHSQRPLPAAAHRQ